MSNRRIEEKARFTQLSLERFQQLSTAFVIKRRLRAWKAGSRMFSQLISVGKLLSGHRFMPARVQRQYIWDIGQCETFHNDLVDAFRSSNPSDYYLGPMILAEDDVDDVAWVYDGQQRLTTLTIYLSALSQIGQGSVQRAAEGLSRTAVAGELRPRIDLRTKGGALTRVVRRTKKFRHDPRNMPVDWRIYNIEKMFLNRLAEIEDLDAFGRWLQRHVVLNVLWAKDEAGLVLFDRANNRGVHLEWFELVKSVVTEGLGQDFLVAPGKAIDEFWYETEREAKHEFSDLIANAAFIRYGKIDHALALASFEDEFDVSRADADLMASGRDLFEKLKSYGRTGQRLQALRQTRADIRSEVDLIRLQLLFLEFPHWKALLMYAEERGLEGKQELAFLRRLRRVAYTAHLLGWPAWPNRIDTMFGDALVRLKSGFEVEVGVKSDLLSFDHAQQAQARGVLSSSMTDESFYRPLVKLWESERAFNSRATEICTQFVAHVEHILPRAPRGDWCRIFPDEDERAELRNKLGNLCLLSKDDNVRAGNGDWHLKQRIYRNVDACYIGARTAAAVGNWTAEAITTRTKQMAIDILALLAA